MSNGTVAVVGAGIAGLTAANRLARDRFDVVVFEKARGVGGRTSTRRRDSDAFDHGAQYFTCRGESFTLQVNDWRERGVVALWAAPTVAIVDGTITPICDSTKRYVGVPGMSALARDLAADLRIECGQRIECLEKAGERWNLILESGESANGFDTVLVAAPAPQAAQLLACAPHMEARAAGVEMQPCHALLLCFDEPLGVAFGGAFVTNSPLAWIARNTIKPGRPPGESWVLHTTADWSARHLDDSIESVTDTILRSFENSLRRPIPRLTSQAVHLWRFARTPAPLGTPFLWDSKLGLGACGDWMNGARVEDAFTSGSLLAEAVSSEKNPAMNHA